MKKIQNSLFLIGLTLAALAAARADDSKAIKEELAKLQGAWSMTTGTADGYAMPNEMVTQCKRICQGDEVTVTMGSQLIMKAKIILDPSKKPKTIDFEMTDGFTKGKKQLGIYELDGDTFKSCFGSPGAGRPADFTSRSGEGRTSTVWKRAKDPAGK